MTFPFTINLEPDVKLLVIDEIPLVTAFARYPARDDETHEYAIERQLLRIEYEGAVSRAIEAGTITPLNPFSLERHTFPRGNALKEAVISVEEYKQFAASLHIQVEVSESNTANEAEPKDTETTPASWVEQVRAIALEYITKHKANDLFPSQQDVCGHIETVARAKKIYGPQGKPISQSYIQRNAIQGNWWKKNKP